MPELIHVETRLPAATEERLAAAEDVGRQLDQARETDRAYREQRKADLERKLDRAVRFYIPLAKVLWGIAALLGLSLLVLLFFHLRYGWEDSPSFSSRDALRSPIFYFGPLIAQSLASMVVSSWMQKRQAALEKELAEYAAEETVP